MELPDPRAQPSFQYAITTLAKPLLTAGLFISREPNQ